MMHLHVSLATALVRPVDANLAQDLARFKSGGQQVNKEIIGVDDAFAALADRDKFSVQRDDRSRPIARRIGVRETATDRSLVSYLHVTDGAGAFRQQRANPFQQLR